MDSKEKDPFRGLGWKLEIVKLADPHVCFNPSPECEVIGAK